jgi:quinol monooxygenase YgiN
MVHVIATVRLQDGTREAFLDQLRQIVSDVHAENGCLQYEAAIDLSTGLAAQPPLRDDVVTVVEQWRDLAALKAHLAAPHMIAYRERVKSMVIGTTLHVLTPVAGSRN